MKRVLSILLMLTIVNSCGVAKDIMQVKDDDPGRCYLLVAMWFLTNDRDEATNWWIQERGDWPYMGYVLEAYEHYADDCDDSVVYGINAPTQAALNAHVTAGHLVAIQYLNNGVQHVRWMNAGEDIHALGVTYAYICEFVNNC